MEEQQGWFLRRGEIDKTLFEQFLGIFKSVHFHQNYSEPVWPSSKALGW